MFVLKRLADAQRDGDHIYAVLRGIGLSNDGKGKHLLTPNPKGQWLAFERAYAAARWPPKRWITSNAMPPGRLWAISPS